MCEHMKNAIEVEVQIWGPVSESAFIAYDWITIGTVNYAAHQDFTFLRGHVQALLKDSEYKPFLNACRFKFPSGAKVTMTELW